MQGALETLRHSLHRQRRDGLGAGDGQVAHQARLARERHPDAALSRRRRAHRLDARRGRARPAADREAGARRARRSASPRWRRSITTSWRSRTREAAQHDPLVLVEEFVTGQELTASIVNGRALPLIRIEAPQGNYDYHSKYFSDETKYFCPAGPAGREGDGDPRDVPARLRHRRLQRLGPARPHPARRRHASRSSR